MYIPDAYDSSRRLYSRPSSGLKLEAADSNPAAGYVNQDQVEQYTKTITKYSKYP
jgi:hypothetical protein